MVGIGMLTGTGAHKSERLGIHSGGPHGCDVQVRSGTLKTKREGCSVSRLVEVMKNFIKKIN